MQTTQQPDIGALVAQVKTALGAKAASVQDAALRDEVQKYLDYGVPAEQAVRTILRHHGVQAPEAAAPAAEGTRQSPLPPSPSSPGGPARRGPPGFLGS